MLPVTLPIQITIRDIANSPALESLIQQRAEKLEMFCQRILNCKVVLELHQKSQQQGKLFNVRIEARVPKRTLVVTRKYNEDVYVAIRDAFEAMERQLEGYTQKRSGRVKTHNTLMHGRVARLIANDGYGFIEGEDGNEYYFSLTNVDFPHDASLMIGDVVQYLPEYASDGRQAHRVVKDRNSGDAA